MIRLAVAASDALIVDVDKQPFIEATQAVRDKFGEKYGDLIKQIQAFAPEG